MHFFLVASCCFQIPLYILMPWASLMTDEVHKISKHSQVQDSAQEDRNTTSAFEHAQVKQTTTMLK